MPTLYILMCLKTLKNTFWKKKSTMIAAYRQQNEILFEISIDVKKNASIILLESSESNLRH